MRVPMGWAAWGSPSLAGVGYERLPTDLEGACRALEQEFSLLVFRAMRKAMVPRSARGADGFARETAYAMLDAQWAKLVSQGEGLGLWKAMYRQLQGFIKEGSRGVDEELGGGTGRTEADHEPQGSARIPVPRTGRAQATTATPTGPGVLGVPAPKGRMVDRSA